MIMAEMEMFSGGGYTADDMGLGKVCTSSVLNLPEGSNLKHQTIELLGLIALNLVLIKNKRDVEKARQG